MSHATSHHQHHHDDDDDAHDPPAPPPDQDAVDRDMDMLIEHGDSSSPASEMEVDVTQPLEEEEQQARHSGSGGSSTPSKT